MRRHARIRKSGGENEERENAVEEERQSDGIIGSRGEISSRHRRDANLIIRASVVIPIGFSLHRHIFFFFFFSPVP